MLGTPLQIWLTIGLLLVFAELLLPGLVSVFLGLGALTVALLLHLNHVDSLAGQLVAWFVSSTFYIFSIRLLVMRYYPSAKVKSDINEDNAMIGQLVEVIEKIATGEPGRILHGESTWVAAVDSGEPIEKGEKARIKRRENITWIVEKE